MALCGQFTQPRIDSFALHSISFIESHLCRLLPNVALVARSRRHLLGLRELPAGVSLGDDASQEVTGEQVGGSGRGETVEV